ncbi:hypothetical protein [Alteromonas lipolytica]|nr:hypothetical protein [Alteromonas lipolytica]GGF57580.1 hypothetical protein GCM10011338_07280 [Alteromonas lipolytica]
MQKIDYADTVNINGGLWDWSDIACNIGSLKVATNIGAGKGAGFYDATH